MHIYTPVRFLLVVPLSVLISLHDCITDWIFADVDVAM